MKDKRGDRFSRRGSPPRDKNPKPWINKPDMFYVHYPGQTPPPFETVKEAVVRKIQAKGGDYTDVAAAIRMLTPIDLDREKPTRQRSVATDPDTIAFENETLMEEFKIAMGAHQARDVKLRQNLQDAYAIIIDEYTSRTIRD